MRQVVLDTETTGLEPEQNHRIIEIGCVELRNRRRTGRTFHSYLNPERDIEDGATDVHGLCTADLADKPLFREVATELLEFIRGSELIIHNAPFDVGFINWELRQLGPEWGRIEDQCRVIDTLALARSLHPGQKNSLDALCARYAVDNTGRELHGALLDARLLADVYLAMTGGQTSLSLEEHTVSAAARGSEHGGLARKRGPLRMIQPNAAELEAHRERLRAIDRISGGRCLWPRVGRGSG
ncbi:MAG: DNA polymerase III subunit epsilon [Gammaproteobacteria bacterium]|nr:DNA polymerase III subunit epsilon [Gammaproteobacteria bacterium]